MAEKSDLLKEIETYIADTQAYAENLRSKQLMQFPQEAYILTGALATEALTDEIGAEAAEKLGLEVISAGLNMYLSGILTAANSALRQDWPLVVVAAEFLAAAMKDKMDENDLQMVEALKESTVAIKIDLDGLMGN